MSYGRIYDDIWPQNIAGYYCADLTSLVKPQLDVLYPGGWEANTHLLLITKEGYPHIGQWHRDAPPYEDDHIVLYCLAGLDEFQYKDGQKIITTYLRPGGSKIMPAATEHRGRCSSYRITYHCRVGPKGRVMPESPQQIIPPMTVRRFLGRTWRTLRYFLWLCRT